MSFNISILIQFYATYPSKTVGAEMLTFCYSISQARRKLQNQFSSKWWSEHFLIVLRQCKIDSWDWTLFSFVFHMVSWRLVLVMVPTVFDKTQARARKSIFCVKSYKNVSQNHLKLIRDKLKILFGAENSGLKWGAF